MILYKYSNLAIRPIKILRLIRNNESNEIHLFLSEIKVPISKMLQR